jgi:hypothetical protein
MKLMTMLLTLFLPLPIKTKPFRIWCLCVTNSADFVFKMAARLSILIAFLNLGTSNMCLELVVFHS